MTKTEFKIIVFETKIYVRQPENVGSLLSLLDLLVRKIR